MFVINLCKDFKIKEGGVIIAFHSILKLLESCGATKDSSGFLNNGFLE